MGLVARDPRPVFAATCDPTAGTGDWGCRRSRVGGFALLPKSLLPLGPGLRLGTGPRAPQDRLVRKNRSKMDGCCSLGWGKAAHASSPQGASRSMQEVPPWVLLLSFSGHYQNRLPENKNSKAFVGRKERNTWRFSPTPLGLGYSRPCEGPIHQSNVILCGLNTGAAPNAICVQIPPLVLARASRP
ncbi:hypothetical protein P7K49_024315 [Saguinus oedipus]|uniref:Uncharacterized protein n=1 Tax=Saguinus oedipus TaxID=9490 RepID=A0ABQ9UP62_SAGOE|nr:hypothetical protein P7K49_024315 [Saguinus oedipus]